jgi:hypothetical protein
MQPDSPLDQPEDRNYSRIAEPHWHDRSNQEPVSGRDS